MGQTLPLRKPDAEPVSNPARWPMRPSPKEAGDRPAHEADKRTVTASPASRPRDVGRTPALRASAARAGQGASGVLGQHRGPRPHGYGPWTKRSRPRTGTQDRKNRGRRKDIMEEQHPLYSACGRAGKFIGRYRRVALSRAILAHTRTQEDARDPNGIESGREHELPQQRRRIVRQSGRPCERDAEHGSSASSGAPGRQSGLVV